MKQATTGERVLDLAWFLAWGLASSLWCVSAAGQLSATFDEPFYVARGLEFWRTGSHSGLLRKGTMPLPVDLSTLPLYLWERWHGVQFDPVSDLDRMLPWARATTLCFWWLLLAYGWLAARRLAGPWAGRLAVAWLASEPNLLAHASLATTDIPVSACLLALVYHFRTGRGAGWIRRVGLPTFWFAASVLSKASGLVLGPLCLLAVELERLARFGTINAATGTAGRWTWLRNWRDRLRPFWRDLVQVILCGLVLVFLYCGSDWRQEPSFVAWARGLPDGAAGRTMVWLAENLRVFPNAGYSLVRQIQHNVRGHGVYLLGQTHRRAFWYYFPLALTIKLSLPVLIMPLVLAAIRPKTLLNWANSAAAALLVFSLTYRVQIGIRFVLPLVVFAVVGLAAAVVQAIREYAPGWRRQILAAGASAGVLWTAVAAAAVWPHGLSYTNELWGGTKQGYRLLSDSNYDWGQGLKELARWKKEQGVPALDVWYYGTDPTLRVLPLREIPLHGLPLKGPEDVMAVLRGRHVAVSTTLLYGTASVESHRIASDFLRTRQPVARTTTFFIYDFTEKRDAGQNGLSDTD